jgi:hypothetical protein
MYDASDGGKQLRKYCGVNLAWWHTFKHVSLLLWRKFAATVWAPLFHDLFPGTQFFADNKNLSAVLGLFQCMQLAYSSLFAQVREDVADLRIRKERREALREILFVCDFAIPTVLPCACM